MKDNVDDNFCVFIQGDVLDSSAIGAAITAATSSAAGKGRLDILVNNAARLGGGHNLLDIDHSKRVRRIKVVALGRASGRTSAWLDVRLDVRPGVRPDIWPDVWVVRVSSVAPKKII